MLVGEKEMDVLVGDSGEIFMYIQYINIFNIKWT